MHQGDQEFGEIEEDLSKVMVYGHSAVASAGIARPLDDYLSILRSDKFYIYLDIYSLKQDSQYYVHICILDCTQTIPDTERIIYFEKLDEVYRLWIQSYLMVFFPFKRNILNFSRDELISLEYFYEKIREWLPPIVKDKNGL